MSSTNTLDRAIELVRKAIDEDTKQNYSEALKYYQNSLDYFLVALKYEKNEHSRDLIRAKINEYLTRAEMLKDFLMTQRRGNSSIGVNRGRSTSGPSSKSRQDGAGDGEEKPDESLTKRDTALLDGADGDDVAQLDGAGDHVHAHLDGAGDDEGAGLDGSNGASNANSTEAAIQKAPNMTEGGAKSSSNVPSELSCKRPFWKRIVRPSKS